MLQHALVLFAGSSCPAAAVRAPDWDRVCRLARIHRLQPLLLWAGSLPGWGLEPLPPAIATALRAAARRVTARNAILVRRLGDVTGRLGAAGIDCLVLKGAAMEALVYAPRCPRPFDDLDILVEPAAFAEARRVLVAAGYTPRLRLREAEVRAHMRAGWDSSLLDPEGAFTVELCTGVAPAHILAPGRLDWWAGVQSVDVGGGVTVRTPSWRNQVLLTVLHGGKHAWSRLVWLADLAGLLRGADSEAWADLDRAARRAGIRRLLLSGAGLADALTGAGVARGTAADESDRGAAALAAAYRLRIEAGPDGDPHGAEELRLMLRARERGRDRLRHVLLLALTPSYADWRWVKLPSWLFAVYYLLRPWRLALLTLRQLLRQ